jgi:hypothetical protein
MSLTDRIGEIAELDTVHHGGKAVDVMVVT